MSDIRSEYANFETQNSHSLREAKREIEETSKALTEKEAEAQKLLAKNQKLRDNTDKLKESIEEYREQQQELQSKLQQENKINQGKYVLEVANSKSFFLFNVVADWSKKKAKCQQHPVFPGGLPSKY